LLSIDITTKRRGSPNRSLAAAQHSTQSQQASAEAALQRLLDQAQGRMHLAVREQANT
jgi:hypothetical protein